MRATRRWRSPTGSFSSAAAPTFTASETPSRNEPQPKTLAVRTLRKPAHRPLRQRGDVVHLQRTVQVFDVAQAVGGTGRGAAAAGIASHQTAGEAALAVR